MPVKNVFGWKGYYPDLEPQDVPDGGLLINSKNFRVVDGILKGRVGYEKLQTASLSGIPLRFFKYRKLDGTKILIAATTTDVYRLDETSGTFKFLTENYATGTITSDASPHRDITLAGGTWDVTWDDYTNPCYIGFATDDIDAITTWYEVDSIDSTTGITLAEDGPDNTAGSIKFVLRRTYNATTQYRWNCETFYDAGEDLNLLILTNGVDYPRKWDGDTTTPHFCEILGGTPPKAKYVAQLGGRLIFGNIITVQASMTGTDLVYTIIWSPVADAESWEGGAADDAGYQELYGTMGDIKLMAPFGYYLCIAKSDAIILLNVTGIAATPFNPTYVTTKRGVNFDTYGIINEFLGFITEGDIVLFDGTANLRSIAEDKIRKTFFQNLNPLKKYGVVSTYAPRFDEWRIYVNNIDEDYPSQTWIYKIKDNEWFYDDVGFTAAGAHDYAAGLTIDGLDAVYATIDDINVAIDALSPTKLYDDVVTSTSAGIIYVENSSLKTLDGNDISMIAITKDFIGSDLELKDRYSEIWVVYRETGSTDDAFKIAISVDGGVSYTSFQNITDTDGNTRIQKATAWNKSGRTCRIMLDGRYMEIYGFKLLFTPQGLR